jgi:hypothetical protein
VIGSDDLITTAALMFIASPIRHRFGYLVWISYRQAETKRHRIKRRVIINVYGVVRAWIR